MLGVPSRQALIDAAIRLFAERGYDATGVREIVDQANLTKGLGVMTKHFPNRFFMYGPATNAGGGRLLALADSWLCITKLVRALVNSGAAAVEPKPEAHDDYSRELDEANQ